MKAVKWLLISLWLGGIIMLTGFVVISLHNYIGIEMAQNCGIACFLTGLLPLFYVFRSKEYGNNQ